MRKRGAGSAVFMTDTSTNNAGRATVKLAAESFLTGGVLFVIAGTVNWPAAWLYLAVCVGGSYALSQWLRRHDPELFVKRMLTEIKPREIWDKVFVQAHLYLMVLALVACAVDKAVPSGVPVPVYLQGPAFVFVAASYAIDAWVFRYNRFAIRTVELQQGQEVIGGGPYRLVRHPMYTALIFLYIGTPLALGSFAGLIPAAVAAALLIVRTYLEDRLLLKGLSGYGDYVRTVKYRLIPGLW